jgi:protein TonB
MREGANRSFGLALLASLLLHALLLAALPSLRELAAQMPKVPAPLIARLMQAEPAPPSSPPVEHARRQPAPEARRAPPPVAKPVPVPAPIATPVPQAQTAIASTALPSAPAAAVAVAPAPAAAPAAAPPAPGPVARIEPQPVAASAAPPGPDPGALDRYRLQLVTAAARFKRYPRSAIDNNWEGVVVVRMTIGADGRIAALGIKESSGHEVLDRQALDMFRTAKPFVLLPPELAGREFELELRAIYSLRDQPSG